MNILCLLVVCALLGQVLGFAPFAPNRARSQTALGAEKPSVTIFGHPGTRSPLVNWACLELGVDFTMGDLSKNPHPFGQIPCVTDSDGVLLFESGAILQYLNFEYANLSKAQRAAVISWITWANASLDPICFLETPDGKVYDTGLRKKNKRIDRLESILEKQEYLVEDIGFSLADVAVGSYLLYVVQFFPDCGSIIGTLYPNVAAYMLRVARRDAYGKAFSDRVQQFVVKSLAEGPSKKLFGVF